MRSATLSPLMFSRSDNRRGGPTCPPAEERGCGCGRGGPTCPPAEEQACGCGMGGPTCPPAEDQACGCRMGGPTCPPQRNRRVAAVGADPRVRPQRNRRVAAVGADPRVRPPTARESSLNHPLPSVFQLAVHRFTPVHQWPHLAFALRLSYKNSGAKSAPFLQHMVLSSLLSAPVLK